MRDQLFSFLIGCLLISTGNLKGGSPGLQIGYRSAGLQSISYNGVVLEDLPVNPSDAFHIWHMKSTDLSGKLLTAGQYGWGEVNNGKTWDPIEHAWTYSFVWGSIRVQYFQSGDTLGFRVTESNNANSGIIFDGATIYPLVLHFPQLPAGFGDPSYAQLATNTTGPSATLADYGTGEVVAVFKNAAQPLYTGFEPAGGIAYTTLIGSTSPDSLAPFFPHYDRPIKPGQSDSFTVMLRFAPSGTALSSIASDVYTSWAKTWPPKLSWPDRRIIGSVYLASSPQRNPTQGGGYPNNPRRYFNDGSAQDFDIRTSAGLAKFQTKILQQANNNVQNLRELNAQGVITWDIEGEQYPQPTSYVCEPDLIAQAAPEMESIVSDPSSPYAGSKLDDAYFSIIRNAGFRVGVCVRPQQFTLNTNGTAGQTYLADSLVAAQLIRKMKYAHDRWGATLFYVDSSVDLVGATLPVGTFQKAAAALPDSLVIPEETTDAFYAYTAAFNSFIFHTDLGTPAAVYNYYPNAFSVNLVNDVDPGKLAQHRAQLTASVKLGDILVVHADYWQRNNPTVMQIYADAASAQRQEANPALSSDDLSGPDTAARPPTSEMAAAPMDCTVITPAAGQTVAGIVTVNASAVRTSSCVGSHLLIDGAESDVVRTAGASDAWILDTSGLSEGLHALQLQIADSKNTVPLSEPVTIFVKRIP